MTTTWISEDGEPVDKKISIIGWLLVMVRGALIILVITTGQKAINPVHHNFCE